MQYWIYISVNSIGDKTSPNSLISFIERDVGFIGAINYWKHTFSEEACDLLNIYHYNNRYYYSHMRHCPSRVKIDKSPVIEYMHSLNQEPSRYYIEETRTPELFTSNFEGVLDGIIDAIIPSRSRLYRLSHKSDVLKIKFNFVICHKVIRKNTNFSD